MPKLKLINSLSNILNEIVLGGMTGMIDPKTNKPFEVPKGVDFTKSDSDMPGKVINKWSGELGTSSIFKTTCDAPLEEQVLKIIRGEEGFISKMRFDESWFRIGYGSMFTTYTDGTWETLPNKRDHSNGSECDSPLGFQYCTHPAGENKYGVPWVDYEITEEDALRDFNRITKDMRDKMEKYVGSEIWSETPDCVKSSLNSLAYNCGSVKNFILDAIKEKDYCKAADGIESVCLTAEKTNTDLSPRRKKEADWIRECTKCMSGGISPNIDPNMSSSIIPSVNSIIIGDSTVPWLARQVKKAQHINSPEWVGSTKYIWLGGIAVGTLNDYVSEYPTVDPNMKYVVITIGTNGAFRNTNGIVGTLMTNLKTKFPNAKFLVVQGAYGPNVGKGKPDRWGGYRDLQTCPQSRVDNFYGAFENEGATVITPAIGNVDDVHQDLSVYRTIGKNIDDIIK